MLKFLGITMSLAVLVTLAYVSPTYAASADISIAQIQAGGVGSATQEFILLFNNTAHDVDISNWCLKNKSNIAFACFEVDPTRQWYISAYGYAMIASSAYPTNHHVGLMYEPTNQSSGSIVGSSDSIILVDSFGSELDRSTWSTSITGGMTWKRKWQSDSPPRLLDTDASSDWTIESPQFLPDDQTYFYVPQTNPPTVDLCPNIDGDQIDIPPGMINDGVFGCIEPAPTPLPLEITELLPNATGTDIGHEYIELYNPNPYPVLLDGYLLVVGPELDKSYSLPLGLVIEGKSYLVISNTDVPFSLLNSFGKVRLTDFMGMPVFETPLYEDPKDDQAWSRVGDAWLYTTMTPGAPNVLASSVTVDKAVDEAKPCATNQFRNPETGRCKLIASESSTRTPCKDNQYRSEETGRCRNIVAASTPTPCKEGQERNPDTNRCRTVTKMPAADYQVLGAQSNDGNNWYVWVAIIALLLLASGYAIWEWRYELKSLFVRFPRLLPRHK